jgi:endonuclease-8
MSEGPQVKLVTERLSRYLLGRTVTDCKTTRPNLGAFVEAARGRKVTRLWCKGKHIFLAFGHALFLQNHLLMRGSWRKLDGRLLLLPDETWLALEVSNTTVCNSRGQMLRPLTEAQVEEQLGKLGPDVMSDDCNTSDVVAALSRSELPIGEALLEQSLLSGIGNVGKSEALFLAGVRPQAVSRDLAESSLARLAKCIDHVMWDSYRAGGRWTHRVYRRNGRKCFLCGTRIAMIRQGKACRSTFFCPRCQGA